MSRARDIADGTLNSADINGGTIDGTDITVGSGKTLDVSAGTLTTSDTQKQAIVNGGKSVLTASDVGLGNVTNESKATMFTNPVFTGTISAPSDSISGDVISGGTISNFASTGIDDNLTSGGPALTIDSSGNLFVGTTGFTYLSGKTDKLQSYTTTGAQFVGAFDNQATSGAYGVGIRSKTGHNIFFYNGTSASSVGTITTTASTTSYNTSSDYRLKEDWQPMSGSIDRLKALNPVNFAWKVDGRRVDGFLAHEAQAVVPEAVTGEKDAVDADGNPEYQGIDQAKLVPLLTAALQEAVSKIEALTARIEVLENAAG